MPHFRAHQCTPPFPALHRVSPLMSHVSKLTNGLLPHPPPPFLIPSFQHPTFLPSPPPSPPSLPPPLLLLVSHLPLFHSPAPPPPSPSPPFSQSSFVTCPVSKLPISLLPLPPLPSVSPPL